MRTLDEFICDTNSLLTFPHYEKPFISIIIVLHNKADYTYRCLQSILDYADVPFELIIVDNASTDSTPVLLQKVKNIHLIKNEKNVGFLNACNTAVEYSNAHWILFLNNDAEIKPYLLSSLLKSGEKNTDCGAVGAKLIFPDGKLQEAGCIIWNDGSCLGYGRGDHPNKPEYSFEREVDYCSGACLLVKRELFQLVGKFDERFLPAYYEDVDLCMKIREQGYKVMFQPSAVVIHHEYGSSSQNMASQLMAINRIKFLNKWKNKLSSFYPASAKNVLFAKERRGSKRKRILFVEDRIPAIELGAGYPRSFRILECLAKLNFSVTLFPLIFPEKREPYTNILQQEGIEVVSGDIRLNFQSFYFERSRYYDVIWISRPHNMKAIIGIIKGINPQQKVVYDAEAIYSNRTILMNEVHGNYLSDEQKISMVKEEISLMNHADIVVAVSESEKKTIQEYCSKNVQILSHTVEADPTPNSFHQRLDILFVGTFLFDPTPNSDAILYFVQNIYPTILDQTGAKLWIVGTNQLPSIQNLSSNNIIVTGTTNKIRDYYNECRIFIAPVRYAAGIPLKMLECFSFGLPAIVSPLIASQLGIADQELIGRDSVDFANKVIHCYNNEAIWNYAREKGLKFIEKECSWDGFQDRIRQMKL
ncbi:glycosyltransferase [Aneurinibacillus sp. Ricciae_BoGa-3]|uniref:glycosyltransferase n=1 Tax=Aneurinibacillus sp. Ricciae_BoGa-3 TaxID=3022697 RepID=UPI00233FCBD5|nr:glycosyltransferase [Aneurinibacillus sp. Ricciae_BoGa-3]WCK56183.1 glycosyltransferase [Aneurinibacillus sp. Ricciae_BoGa-3]